MINKFISGFMSGLSDQGKKLLTIALLIVVVALFDRLLIAPTMSRLAAIDEETAMEERKIKEDLQFLAYKDKILNQARAVEPYLMDNLPSDDEVIAAFLKKIEILAAKANVIVAKVTPAAASEDAGNRKYAADLECSGVLADIVSFMHLINASEELTKVVRFNLGAKKADSDEVKATMTVVKIIIARKAVTPTSMSLSGNAQADASNVAKN